MCPGTREQNVSFPDAPNVQDDFSRTIPYVVLLAGICMKIWWLNNTISGAHANRQRGRTHIQVYWFQDLDVVEPFDELINILLPIIQSGSALSKS
ncbi:hypothetical protein K457DRAFT_735682 [Linnemannia elongata AG-77]|uniref:Uncharacterized protein n=1 Tax=Linnemannia elongata AG-77 TaxID=1314771 RepID=A0A197JNV4_9FUNG|nr:hypothetical protein K457DRAFT_735682 [Linnemannia elongata AG-77]